MKNSFAVSILAVMCLFTFPAPSSLLAQGDELDEMENPYSEAGQDTDEIMEIDDALTDEARAALEEREAMALLDGVHWLGQAAFLIEDEVTIYIDPFDLPDGLPGADLILVTHGHRDHLSPGDLVKILRPNTKVVTTEAARSLLPEEAKNVIPVVPGESIEVDDVKIEVVPAYNKDKDFHPKERGDAGYVIHLEGRTIYHAGDTDFIDEMKIIEADVALLPAGGTYTMDAREAAMAANAIEPRVAIPMHWGKVVGGRKDAEAFVEACEMPAFVLEVYSPEAGNEPEPQQEEN